MRAARTIARTASVVSLLSGATLGPLSGQQTGPDTVPAYDPGAPAQARNRLTPSLAIGARLVLDYQFRRGWDLTDRGGDDRSTLAPEPSVAVAFSPNPGLRAFASLELSRRFALSPPGNGDRDFDVDLRQAYLQLRSKGDGRYSVRLGRQRFKDRREWIFDEELDGLRFRYDTRAFDMEVALARGRDSGDERVSAFSLEADLRPASGIRAGAFILLRDESSVRGDSPIFLGLRSSGGLAPDLDYWAQVAQLTGRTGSRRLRATGIDLGVTYRLDAPFQPALTVAYAYGSGDRDPEDDVDGEFRQTGFQGNQDRFAGVTNFKYYGELLDPELGNLAIVTVGLGVRPSRRSSAELIGHWYRQPVASIRVRNANISADPSGRHRDIGSEVDLVLGFREIRDVTLKLVLGWFHPGRAFEGPVERGAFGEIKIDYRI